MPKKAIKTTKKSKDIKQKQNQTQKQTVNVNINQTKTTKKTKTSRKKNNLPQTPVIYNYGQSSVGNPSDNLLYNRPPVIAQVIPAMGGDTNALMPPSNTSIETILKAMKEKTDRIMRPSKKLTDSGTQDIFNMEPKKKFEYKPETLTTIAPKGIKIQVPKQPPFKLTGEIVQRKNTDMQTEPQINIPKRKQLTDTGSNEIFNKPSETNDYKSILNTSNKEMAKIIKRVEKLSSKKPKETKPIETQTEPQNIKSFSSIATETQNIIKHGGTQTEILKPKKLIFNPKNIEKRKQILKYKDYVPGNLLTVQGKQKKITPEINKKLDSYLVPQTISEKVQKKDELKKKAHSILAGVQTNIPAFKYLPPPQKSSLTIVKKKQPLKMNEKSLANITDINVSKSKDALKHFTKINNMFKDATKSDKNMNDIL